MAGFALFSFQHDADDAIMQSFRNERRRVLAVLPTSAGKSVIAATIASRVAGSGGRVLLMAHTEELVDQLADRLRAGVPAW